MSSLSSQIPIQPDLRIIVGLKGFDAIFQKQCEEIFHLDLKSQSDWTGWVYLVNESLKQMSTIICDDYNVYVQQLTHFPQFRFFEQFHDIHTPVGQENFTKAFRAFALHVYDELNKVSSPYRQYDYLLEHYQENMVVFMLCTKGEYLDKF